MLFQIKNTNVYLLASMHLLPFESKELPAFIWDVYHQCKICVFEDNHFQPRFPYPPFKSEQDTYYPWASALLRTNEIAREMGLLSEYGVDTQLLMKAMEDQLKIDYLDTENACNAFARAPIEEQKVMLDVVQNSPHKIRDILERTYAAWRTWDVMMLTELLNHYFTLCPELYRHLIITRNQAWLPSIIGLVIAKAPVLIVVGALHFIGRDGICHHIKKHGYDLLKYDFQT